MTASTPITIRLARADDAAELAALAQLDSAAPPAQPVLVAETRGDLVAAVSLLDGVSVSDPFRPTADVVELLRMRAARLALRGRGEESGIRVWLWPRRRARPLVSAP